MTLVQRSLCACAGLAASLAFSGCGEPTPPEESPPVTAPVIPWLAAGEPTIAPPEIPWLDGESDDPVTRACPSGWHTRTTEAGSVCDPWPEGGRMPCTGATAMRPGEATCTPIGRACPSDPEIFPADAPSGAIFVREGAVAGTGSRDAPFGTLSEAIAHATAGQSIVLGAGDHDAALEVSTPVTIRGACAERTRLRGPLTAQAAITIEDVTVSSDGLAISVQRGGLTARGLVIDDHVGNGLELRAGIHAIEDVVIRGGTGPVAGSTAALHVTGGSLTASRVVVEGREGYGLVIDGRATAEISDSVFADGTALGAPQTALVLVSETATMASFTRTVIEDGVNQLLAANAPTTLEDVLVQGARIQPGQEIAIGVTVFGELVARGLRTHDIDGFGVACVGHAELEDYVADGTHGMSAGIHSEEGGSIVARRVRLGPIAIGARAYVRGALELEDASIHGATRYSIQADGEESVASLRRIVARDGVSGLRVGADSNVSIEDAVFEDLESAGIGDDGIGVYLRSHVTARRIRASRTHNSCFAVLQSATLDLADARCEDAELGLVAAIEGSLTAARVTIDRIVSASLVAEDQASLVVEDVVVRHVGPTELISVGLNANNDSSATLRRVTMSDIEGYAASCIRHEAQTTSVTLEDVAITDTTLAGITPDCALTAHRVDLLRPGVVGLGTTAPEADVELVDFHVADVQVDPVDGRFGHGLHLVGGGRTHGERVVIERARGGAIVATGAGTTVELGPTWLSGTRAAVCGAGCTAGGSGLSASDGASVTVTSLRSFGHEVAGVQLASGASVVLHGGWIHDNAIGRNLPPDADATPLLDAVMYVHNGAEEDRRALPLPAATLF
ncbi:MAG: hypothetical protein U0353_25435 [Sandaracinus sp.]